MLTSKIKSALTQIDWTIPKVVQNGIDAGLFGDEAHGWFTIASKQGYPFRQGSTDEPSATSLEYRASVEAQVVWLSKHDLHTSTPWEEINVGNAVAVRCDDFYIGYASGLTDRLWNQAIVVVSAIRVYQFNVAIIFDERLHLKQNPHIQPLLKVAN